MAETAERKLETRRRILAAASKGFRSRGYAGTGVDGIAKEAGVTSGAFYAHLGSKDEAFAAALEIGLDEALTAIPTFQAQHGAQWLEVFVDYYIGRAHRVDLAYGCAMATLSPEVVRFGPAIHALYEKKMTAIVDAFAEGLASGSMDERRSRARATIALLIGGLTVARGMESGAAADAVAESVKSAAVAAAGLAIP